MSLAEQETSVENQLVMAMPEGAPNFYEWSDSDKLTYLCASMFSLKSDLAQVKELAGQVAVQAGPIIEKVQSSPIFKLIGGR